MAKIVTGLIALIFAVAIVGSSRKKEEGPTLKVTNLNEKYEDLKSSVKPVSYTHLTLPTTPYV